MATVHGRQRVFNSYSDAVFRNCNRTINRNRRTDVLDSSLIRTSNNGDQTDR